MGFVGVDRQWGAHVLYRQVLGERGQGGGRKEGDRKVR